MKENVTTAILKCQNSTTLSLRPYPIISLQHSDDFIAETEMKKSLLVNRVKNDRRNEKWSFGHRINWSQSA